MIDKNGLALILGGGRGFAELEMMNGPWETTRKLEDKGNR